MSATHAEPKRLLAQADLLFLFAAQLDPPRRSPEPREPHSPTQLQALARAAGLGTPNALALSRSLAAAAVTTNDATRREYDRLFEGAVACPPNETAYIRRDKGAILGDIAGFYHAFGFDLEQDLGEKHDHIVAELQFTALLLVLLARAEAAGRAEPAQIVREALRAFGADHLGAWIDAFVERLAAEAVLPCYGSLAHVLQSAWRVVVATNGIPPAEALGAPPLADRGTPYECGMCPAESPRDEDASPARPASARVRLPSSPRN